MSHEDIHGCRFAVDGKVCGKPADWVAQGGEYPLYVELWLCAKHYDALNPEPAGWKERTFERAKVEADCTFCDLGQAYPSGPYAPHSPTCPLMRDPLLREIGRDNNPAYSIPVAAGGGGAADQPTGNTGTNGQPWPCAHPVTLDRKEYGVLVKRTCGVCGEVLAGSGGFGGSVGHRCTDNRNEPCTPDHCQAEEFCPARTPRESVKVGGNCQGVLSCSGEGCAWPGHKPKTVNECLAKLETIQSHLLIVKAVTTTAPPESSANWATVNSLAWSLHELTAVVTSLVDGLRVSGWLNLPTRGDVRRAGEEP